MRTQPMPHQTLNRRNSYFFWLLLFIAIPVVGYAIMHGMVYVFPMQEDSTLRHLMITVAIIALGLAVPYWMLKAGLFAARKRNVNEDNVTLEDLPKSQRPAGRRDLN
jgi:magnesium-transporting ATPase (P-type)